MDIHTDTEVHAEASAPRPLWVIALLGLAPFPTAAVGYVFGPADVTGPALTVLLTWSAVVLGFLGGIRWGLESARAAPRWTRLAMSIVSPAVAWALVFARGSIDVPWLLCGFMAAFILQWLFDHAAPDVPARYPRLMTTLTLGACISLALALEQALRM
ncbi:MAG: DUF3429 domain-containing protein [Pseudomonadota bacterium]|uniref:DUF3429 domain-containing protein n=1 Tax=unclassified Phenylobacterium TaxID=2640670 RepID=UPI0006FDC71D|nr:MULTISPECIES: DUF3429 domain-containing protein [unclassified Phenylobacterium]KRB48737.1 hypothetical protein ASE02_18000 [Phenylobacterium sp. Root700]MBT9473758.1 DUF3429 domain-containing protein [Phenylobacterium sp.]